MENDGMRDARVDGSTSSHTNPSIPSIRRDVCLFLDDSITFPCNFILRPRNPTLFLNTRSFLLISNPIALLTTLNPHIPSVIHLHTISLQRSRHILTSDRLPEISTKQFRASDEQSQYPAPDATIRSSSVSCVCRPWSVEKKAGKSGQDEPPESKEWRCSIHGWRASSGIRKVLRENKASHSVRDWLSAP